MKILHLIDPDSVHVGAETLAVVADTAKRLPHYNHDVLIIANAQWTTIARRIGLKTIGSISPAGGNATLARRALQSVIRSNESIYGAYDVIHAWTLNCAVMASSATSEHQIVAGPLLANPCADNFSKANVKKLNRSVLRILCATNAIKQQCIETGIDQLLLSELSPAIDSLRIAPGNRALLRDAWGVDNDTFTVGLVGNAHTAIMAATRVIHTQRDVKLIVHPDAQLRSQATQWASRLGEDAIIIIDNKMSQLWDIARGLDAAIITAPQSQSADHNLQPNNIISVLWLMASGIPIIIDPAHPAATYINDGTGIITGSPQVNSIAHGILRYIDEPEFTGQIRNLPRKNVADQISADNFAADLGNIYQQAFRGQRVQLIETDASIMPPEKVKLVANSPKNSG